MNIIILHFHDDGEPLLVLVSVDDLHDVLMVEQGGHHVQLIHQLLLHQRVIVALELGRVLVAAVLVDHPPHRAVRAPVTTSQS